MKTDVLVLGGGIVGVSVAWHLKKRGLATALVDRRAPGEETSFGNAGVIERSALFPVAFPRDLVTLLRVGIKRAPQANYNILALPPLLPWLWAYFHNSTPRGLEHTARSLFPLVDRSLAEHEEMMAASGLEHLLRRTGWMRVFRGQDSFRAEREELLLADELGVPYEVRDCDGARELEPDLAPVFRNAVWWPSTASVSDPGALVAGYAATYAATGGLVAKGDARTLARVNGKWRIETDHGSLSAGRVVLALGPWMSDVLARFGLEAIPLAVKRGYHVHYRPAEGAGLSRPIVDVDGGYALAPMTKGLRLTTGVEFAGLRAPASPDQIRRTLPYLRELFPRIEHAVEDTPWVGARPCLPDSLPVIGPSPHDPDLWLAFGHQHLGFTLGPVTGRLVAEMMTSDTPLTDPAPFRAERFL